MEISEIDIEDLIQFYEKCYKSLTQKQKEIFEDKNRIASNTINTYLLNSNQLLRAKSYLDRKLTKKNNEKIILVTYLIQILVIYFLDTHGAILLSFIFLVGYITFYHKDGIDKNTANNKLEIRKCQQEILEKELYSLGIECDITKKITENYEKNIDLIHMDFTDKFSIKNYNENLDTAEKNFSKLTFIWKLQVMKTYTNNLIFKNESELYKKFVRYSF